MKSLRLIVNCVAAFVGLVGLGWALFGPIVLIRIFVARQEQTDPTILFGIVLFAAVLAIVGSLMLRQAWVHWRQPDRHTANAVSGMASLALGLYSLQLTTGRNAIIPKLEGLAGSLVPLASALALILACYVIYRHALKPLAARAYPIGDLMGGK